MEIDSKAKCEIKVTSFRVRTYKIIHAKTTVTTSDNVKYEKWLTHIQEVPVKTSVRRSKSPQEGIDSDRLMVTRKQQISADQRDIGDRSSSKFRNCVFTLQNGTRCKSSLYRTLCSIFKNKSKYTNITKCSKD